MIDLPFKRHIDEARIRRFCAEHAGEEVDPKSGVPKAFVLKYSYTTNYNHGTFNSLRKSDVESVIDALVTTEMCYTVSEAILQVELANRYEYKIVCFNGQGESIMLNNLL